MLKRFGIVDPHRFLAVLRRLGKYIVLIPLIASVILSPVLSFFALLEGSHGRFCSVQSEGLIYHDIYECFLDFTSLFEIFPIMFVGIFAIFLVIVFSVISIFYIVYLIYAPGRVGVGLTAERGK